MEQLNIAPELLGGDAVIPDAAALERSAMAPIEQAEPAVEPQPAVADAEEPAAADAEEPAVADAKEPSAADAEEPALAGSLIAEVPQDEPVPVAADELSRPTPAALEPEAEPTPESGDQTAAPTESAPAVPAVAAAAGQAVTSADRASNDPRSAPSPVTRLEVASAQVEIPVSGFIDTSRPAPLSADRPSLSRPANDPRRARGEDQELQSGETAR